MYTWIDALTLLAVGIAFLMAAAIDHRTLRIPNSLTFPLISLGFLLLAFRCAAGYSMLLAGLTCAVSYAFVYGLWKCGLWGGGDAKLVLALFFLVSPAYPPFSYIVAFSLCLAMILFMKYFIIKRLVKAIWHPGQAIIKSGPLSAEDIASLKDSGAQGPMGPSLFLAYLLSIGALTVVPIP